MAMCIATTRKMRTECQRPVPEDAPIKLCLTHMLMAHQHIVALGGANAVAAAVRAGATPTISLTAAEVAVIEAEMTDEDRAVRDRIAAEISTDPLSQLDPIEIITEALIDTSGRELLTMAKVVTLSRPRVVVDVLFSLVAIAKRARRVGI